MCVEHLYVCNFIQYIADIKLKKDNKASVKINAIPAW